MNRVKNSDNEWVDELIRRAEIAVEDYEGYLLDKIDSKELALTMKRLREVVRNIKRSREHYSDPIK
jgi:hypothetical protein